MKFSALDYDMMALALRQAEKGLYTADPNPRVGCVLVKGGRVVGTGWHRQAGGAHAEVEALQSAGKDAEGADCYVTLEPCSHYGKTGPCADALTKAGVKRVVIACVDTNPDVSGRGITLLEQAGIATEIGCLSAAAEQLNAGFLQRMRTGLPMVRIKMAVSLDGQTALANGTSQWITGPAARLDVQRLRARSSAVLTGSGTLVADNPQLTVRSDVGRSLSDGSTRQPLRVVIDSSGHSDPAQQLFSAQHEPASQGENVSLILTSPEAYAGLLAKPFPQGTKVKEMPVDNAGKIDLHVALMTLGQLGCNEVLVEAGPNLAGAFLRERLVDEVWLYQAAKIIGSSGRGAFQLPVFGEMSEILSAEIIDVRKIGQDIRMIMTMAA